MEGRQESKVRSCSPIPPASPWLPSGAEPEPPEPHFQSFSDMQTLAMCPAHPAGLPPSLGDQGQVARLLCPPWKLPFPRRGSALVHCSGTTVQPQVCAGRRLSHGVSLSRGRCSFQMRARASVRVGQWSAGVCACQVVFPSDEDGSQTFI